VSGPALIAGLRSPQNHTPPDDLLQLANEFLGRDVDGHYSTEWNVPQMPAPEP
jgi:hypothetical protein